MNMRVPNPVPTTFNQQKMEMHHHTRYRTALAKPRRCESNVKKLAIQEAGQPEH